MDGYGDFARMHPLPWCWACGRGPTDKPSWWYAPWLIERAHIVNKTRAMDVRAVVLLCSGCHKASHGERFPQWTLPRLTLPNLLWLKLHRDPANYDRAFLASKSVRLLPRAAALPPVFLPEYQSRRQRNLVR
jgi:hypothetical protein